MSTLKLPLFTAALCSNSGETLAGDRVSGYLPLSLRLPQQRRFASLSIHSENASSLELSDQSRLTSTSGSSPTLQLVLTPRHIQVLSFVACTAAISATWLFCSAIPALLAFKRATSSLEKLMDVMTEELPETMAAVRLSGMEISDLTMELSDLGQEITQGVRRSTQAVRLTEEKLQQLTNITRSATTQAPMQTTTAGPALARKARGIKEGIVKGRATLQMLFTLSRYSGMIFNFFTSRAKA